MISLGTIEQHILLVQIVCAKFRRPLVGFFTSKGTYYFLLQPTKEQKELLTL